MNRWTRAALLGLSFAAASVLAQGIVRSAPADVKPAIIAVSTTPPMITVDGRADRFSPGARIRDRNNMLMLSGALAGKTLYTVYRRDGAGLVHEVWLLNEEEYAKVGGSAFGNPEGFKRFAELLELVWAARTAFLMR